MNGREGAGGGRRGRQEAGMFNVECKMKNEE
jgi:hypothetical protein